MSAMGLSGYNPPYTCMAPKCTNEAVDEFFTQKPDQGTVSLELRLCQTHIDQMDADGGITIPGRPPRDLE